MYMHVYNLIIIYYFFSLDLLLGLGDFFLITRNVRPMDEIENYHFVVFATYNEIILRT